MTRYKLQRLKEAAMDWVADNIAFVWFVILATNILTLALAYESGLNQGHRETVER